VPAWLTALSRNCPRQHDPSASIYERCGAGFDGVWGFAFCLEPHVGDPDALDFPRVGMNRGRLSDEPPQPYQSSPPQGFAPKAIIEGRSCHTAVAEERTGVCRGLV
jgi:hypothetical protein